MAIIKPFESLRPQPQYARQVASRPYDVLNSAEAKIEAQGNPNSFLHITKSEIDLPEDTHLYSEMVYEKAKENLDAFQKRNILFQDDKACYYLYRLIMNGRSQTGLVALSSVRDYENNIIKKHEFTRPDKELDRITHIKTTRAQTGNVFLAYRPVKSIDELFDKWMQQRSPVYDFVTDDNIQHSIWIINESRTIDEITRLFASEVPCSYIADGHHRAASAAKVKTALQAGDDDEAAYFLTTLFPSNQLSIWDYNRVIKTLNGHTATKFLEHLSEDFEITPMGSTAVKPGVIHEFGLYIDKNWYRLTSKPGTWKDDETGVLDITILQENILSKILGIHDQRTDKNIDFVGGIRGLNELEKRVDEGDMVMAISLYPVSMEQLFSIADAGSVMPPKSTWFEPKLRDGLLTHLI
jgi:uncharacterized protein (DUF1015 family)